jgi:hypothetical protein
MCYNRRNERSNVNLEEYEQMMKRAVLLWVEDEGNCEFLEDALERFWPGEVVNESKMIYRHDYFNSSFVVHDIGRTYYVICGTSYSSKDTIYVANKKDYAA